MERVTLQFVSVDNLFSSADNWFPSEAPVAGDNLYIKKGTAIIYNDTVGADGVKTSIGLIGLDRANPAVVVADDVTFKNVDITTKPPFAIDPPYDYGGAKYGRLLLGGTVTNDGGSITASSERLLSPTNIDIVLAPGSTLINTGDIGAYYSTMTIAGGDGSTLENDGSIRSDLSTVTVSMPLTGTGFVEVSAASSRSIVPGKLELNAPAGSGQTFLLNRALLQLDQPLSFMGQVSADPSRGGIKVSLEGLSATFWDVNGSSVEFFDAAGSVVDQLQFTTPQDPATLVVFAGSDPTYGSVVSVGSGAGFGPQTGDVLLPYYDTAATA